MNRYTSLYLIVRPKSYGSLAARIATRRPRLAHDERALRLDVSLPDALFKQPEIVAQVTVPEACVTPTRLDATTLHNIQEALQQQLGAVITLQLVEPQESQS